MVWGIHLRRGNYKIDGRSIKIIDKTNLNKDTKDSITEVILTICENSKIAKNFENITFILENKKFMGRYNNSLDSFMGIDTKEVYSGKNIIHINGLYLKDKELSISPKDFKTYFFQESSDVIPHELTHIWHYRFSNVFGVIKKANLILSKKLQKILFYSSVDNLTELRGAFNSLFNFFCTEGIATYCSYSENNLAPFEKRVFDKFYHDAMTVFQGFQSSIYWKKHTKDKEGIKKFIKDLSVGKYMVGLHVIYAILYMDSETTIEKLSKMHPFKIIKEYEKHMAKSGYKPVISLTSGEGIFDYKNQLDKLMLLYYNNELDKLKESIN